MPLPSPLRRSSSSSRGLLSSLGLGTRGGIEPTPEVETSRSSEVMSPYVKEDNDVEMTESSTRGVRLPQTPTKRREETPINQLPRPLCIMRWLERVLHAIFISSNLALLAGVSWALAAWTLGAPPWLVVPDPVGMAWRTLVYPVIFVQMLAYAFLLLCTAFSDLQSFAAYGQPASWLGVTRDANERAWAKIEPTKLGLKNTRTVSIETTDGERLGAWHVLPGGELEAEVSRRVEGEQRCFTFARHAAAAP